MNSHTWVLRQGDFLLPGALGLRQSRSMAREPSIPGARSPGGAITQNDGTGPLPPEVARELVASTPAARSGPVEALRPRAAVAHSAAAPAFPKPPRPARPAGMAPAMQALWYEVLERHDALLQQDHFAALDVPYESGGRQVQQAFSKLIARFHPDKLPPELELLQPCAVRIVARLNVARMQLASRRDREDYLRSLGRPIPPPVSEPPPALPGAGRAAVARVIPERRLVPRPASGPQPPRPQPPRPQALHPQAPHPQPSRPAKREERPPSAGVRLMRALRGEGSSSD